MINIYENIHTRRELMENNKSKSIQAAEFIDRLRIVPRLLVTGYSYLVYKVVDWYMNLEPYFPDDIKPMLNELAKTSGDVQLLLVQAPTTQHAALVSMVVGIAAAVFGLYASTGNNKNGSND